MKRLLRKCWSLPALLAVAVSFHAAAAPQNDRERWIVGRWTHHRPGRADRTVDFHVDHSWGVEGYVVSGPNDQLTMREDIRGRRWYIRGDSLVLRSPSDDGFRTYVGMIISFSRDKIVTDLGTYTREQPRQ